MLRLQVAKRNGEFSLEAALSVDSGSVLVLVGESGAGKTTLLRLLAGLQHPDRGRITLDGLPLFDATAGVAVPPDQRPVGYIAQQDALFPHLTVFENVAFGLRAQAIRGTGLRPRVESALARLGMLHLALRRPHQLSGGQQQRAALARALVLEPRLLLLDEPLSALDVQTRRTIRSELRRFLADLGCVTVFVTHSPTEALALGERIAVLEAGRISQHGPREDLLRHPRSGYIAEFLGVNLLRGAVVHREPGALARVAVGRAEVAISDPGREGEVALVVHPREITLSLERPLGSARNTFHGPIEELVPEPPDGEHVRVLLATDPPLAAELTRESVVLLGLRPGQAVYAAFKATGVVTIP